MPDKVMENVDELSLDQVKAWVLAKKEDEEVKGFLTSIAPEKELSKDIIQAYLDSKEGKELIAPVLQSESDRRVSEAVNGRMAKEKEIVEKEVKRRMAEELAKLNPEPDPIQGRLQELEDTIKARDVAYARENLKRQIGDYAHEQGIDPFFLEDYLPETLEQAKLYIKRIMDRDKKRDEKLRNEIIATAGFKPGSGSTPGVPVKKLDLGKLSGREIFDLESRGELDAILEG